MSTSLKALAKQVAEHEDKINGWGEFTISYKAKLESFSEALITNGYRTEEHYRLLHLVDLHSHCLLHSSFRDNA